MIDIALQAKPARTGESESRSNEPVTFGVPLPAGLARDGDAWRLEDAAGRSQVVQTRALDAWPDGSVRWLLIDAQVDRQAGATTALRLRRADDAGPSTAPPPNASTSNAAPAIAVTTDGSQVAVDTGTARFLFDTRSDFLFEDVTVAGDKPLNRAASTLSVVLADGTRGRLVLRTIDVRERGPLRASVKLAGQLVAEGRELLQLTAWIDLFAGHNTVRVRLCVTNPRRAVHRGGFWDLGDPNSILIKELKLAFGIHQAARHAGIVGSLEFGAPWQELASPFELYQDSSGGENWNSTNHVNRERKVPNAFRGYRVTGGAARSSGLRATPIVELRSEHQTVAVAMPAFWENFPKAIQSDASAGVLELALFPAQYSDVHELQGGEQKTHELFVAFGPDTVTPAPLAWTRAQTVMAVDPAWVQSSRAVPFLAPLTADHRALVDAAIEGAQTFEHKRERVDQYGWRHFGELYGDHEAVRHTGPGVLVSHYNNQYDVVAGFAYQFLRTADPRWRRMMIDLATHVVDIDVYHTDEDKSAYNRGLFWHTYHYGDADTATHRSYPRSALGVTHGGGPSADHNYTTGLMHYYFLTGDETARDTIVDFAGFVIALEDGRRTPFRWLDRGETGRATLSAVGYYGAGRAAANSLSVLVDAHRLTREPRFLAMAEHLIRRVIHPKEDIAERRLDVPEQRWFYTMCMQSLGKYLHYKAERGELDAAYAYTRAGFLHYARWMAEHEHPYLEKPEKLQFKTETWAAQDIRKSDAFYFAALHAAGDERARFVERAQFFHDYSTRTLLASPTRALARPVAVLLTSGFMRGPFEREPAAAAPAPAATHDFGEPVRFVPQRERAKKRAVLVAGIGALAFVLVIVMLILR